MRYIERVVIENFQSHEHTEVRFGPGLNVIVGPSDHGKSAILRAVRWALYNQPRGTDFVRAGSTTCRVTVAFSDGTEIVRERANARNRYLLHRPGEAELAFEGFGADVPAEIIQAHGMPPIALDRDRSVELSMGNQLEGPFLLSSTGSDRARAIGRLSGVHLIDAALRLVTRDLNQTRRDTRWLAGEVKKLDEQLAGYADLPEQEAAVERAEVALTEARRLAARAAQLTGLQAALSHLSGEEAQARAALQGLAHLPGAEAAAANAALALARATQLQKLAARRAENAADLDSVQQGLAALSDLPAAAARQEQAAALATRLSRLQGLAGRWQARATEETRTRALVAAAHRATEAAAPLAALVTAAARLDRLQELQRRLSEVQQRTREGERLTAEVRADLTTHVQRYERVLRDLGRCPVCLSPVGPDVIEHIARELLGEEERHAG